MNSWDRETDSRSKLDKLGVFETNRTKDHASVRRTVSRLCMKIPSYTWTTA